MHATSNKDFVRDSNSNALLNKNEKALMVYKAKKKREMEIDEMFKQLQHDIAVLQQEHKNLKTLQKQIINGTS